MARSHVVFALERKYARLLGCQKRLRRPSLSIAADLDHIEAVMRLFDPMWDKASVKPIFPVMPSAWGKRGAGMKAAVQILKEANEPLTTRQIVLRALDRLSIPCPRREELYNLCAGFATSLVHKQKAHGLIAHPGNPRRWSI